MRSSHIVWQIQSLKQWSMPWWTTIRYAMKANPLQGILKLMHSHDIHIDACSDYEVFRALAAWIPADHIQITGQTWPKNLAWLIEQWVRFCACSLYQLEEYWKQFPWKKVWIRLNPWIGSGQFPWVNVWGQRSSFGVWHEYIPQINEIAKKYELKVTTLHTHIWSGSDPYVWQDVAKLSLDFAKKLPDVDIVDLWGWFKVARMLDEKWADMEKIGIRIAQAFENFTKETWRTLHCEIEPGTYLVANSGYLWCSIDDVTDTWIQGEQFIKLTTWMSELIRPIMYWARQPLWTDNQSAETANVIVVGHSCESSDMITVDNNGVALHRAVASPAIGDRVLIGWVGAYCSSMCTVHYNSYPRVAEYLLNEDGTISCLREAETAEDVWKNEL